MVRLCCVAAHPAICSELGISGDSLATSKQLCVGRASQAQQWYQPISGSDMRRRVQMSLTCAVRDVAGRRHPRMGRPRGCHGMGPLVLA